MPEPEKAAKKATKKAPTKKATKKAAKKPTKKAAAKLTPSEVPAEPVELGPEASDALGGVYGELSQQVGESLDDLSVEARAKGAPILLGPATVRLVNEVDGVATPAEAVDKFIEDINTYGLRRWVFFVVDEVTEEVYAVQHGRVIGLEVAEPEEQEDG